VCSGPPSVALGETRKTGLFVEMMHESLKTLWWLAEIFWKRHYN
jgi:hypothetical protein